MQPQRRNGGMPGHDRVPIIRRTGGHRSGRKKRELSISATQSQCRQEDAERRQAAKSASIINAALAEGRLATEGEVLAELHRLFREKFGRDPEPDEPLFFDPDQDHPTEWPEAKATAGMLESMRKAGTPPQIIFAFRKTGLLLAEGITPPDAPEWKEWNAAIDEYFALDGRQRARWARIVQRHRQGVSEIEPTGREGSGARRLGGSGVTW